VKSKNIYILGVVKEKSDNFHTHLIITYEEFRCKSL